MSLRPRGVPQTSVPAVGVPSAPRAFPALSMRLKQVLELGVKRDALGNVILPSVPDAVDIPKPKKPDAVDSIMQATGLSKLAVGTVQGLATYFFQRSESLKDRDDNSNMFLPGSNFDTANLDLLKETFELYKRPEPDYMGMEGNIKDPTDKQLARTAIRLGLNPFEQEVYTNRLVTVDPFNVPHFILNAKKLKLLSRKPEKFQLVANTMHWYITSFLPGRQIITALLHMSMDQTIVDMTDNHVAPNKIVNFNTGELETVLNEIQRYFARIRVDVFEPGYNMFAIKDVAAVTAVVDVGSEFVRPEKMIVNVDI